MNTIYQSMLIAAQGALALTAGQLSHQITGGFWGHPLAAVLILVAAAGISQCLWRRFNFVYSVGAGVIVLLSLLAQFKVIVYGARGDLAHFWMAALVVLSGLWPLMVWGLRYIKPLALPAFALDGAIIAVLVMAVYIPDVTAVAAHIFYGEHWHHLDSFVVGPAWAMEQGAVLNVDVRSQYGIGVVFIIKWMMQLLGGINYPNAVHAVVLLQTSYFVGVYIFLKLFISNRWLALAAWCAIFKAQIAFELAFPLVYTYPQASMARSWFDLWWLMSLYLFLVLGKRRYALMAGLMCAAAIWYVPTTGLYLWAAHLLVTALAAYRLKPMIPTVILSNALAITGAVGLFVLSLKEWFFTPVFWHHFLDFLKMVTIASSSPLLRVLLDNPLAFVIFVVIALTYLVTLVKVGLDYCDGHSSGERLLLIGLCVYGLGQLEHYVGLSLGNNYYGKAMPFFIIAVYWIGQWLKVFELRWRSTLAGMLCVFSLLALVTNHAWVAYPNMLNVSKHPLVDVKTARLLPSGQFYFGHKHRYVPKAAHFPINDLGTDGRDALLTEDQFTTHAQLIAQWRKDNDFAKDADLIRRYTNIHERVVLLSSFEVSILIQAQRKPFFYLFPILDNRPMRLPSYGVDLFNTHAQVKEALDDLARSQPAFVFMEKLMLANPVPAWYQDNAPGLIELLRYLRAHYTPVEAGQYLIALKRI